MAYRIQSRRRLGNEQFAAPIHAAQSSDDLTVNREGLLTTPTSLYGKVNPRRPADRNLKPTLPAAEENETNIEGHWAPMSTGQANPNPGAVTPRRGGTRDELARLRAQESAMMNLSRVDKSGKTLYGVDAVEDRNGRLRSGGEAGLMGLQGVGAGAGQQGYGWAALTAELSRAGGMLVGGMLNKKWDEKNRYNLDLQKNRAQQAGLQGQLEGDAKIDKLEADTTESRAKAVNESIKPLLDHIKEMGYTPEDAAAFISTYTGLPIGPEDHRPVDRFEDMGVPMIARKGEAASAPDPSRYIDPGKVRRRRELNGQEYQVNDEQALGAAVGIENANATRGAAVAKANADIAGDNVAAGRTATKEQQEVDAKRAKVQGDIDGSLNDIKILDSENERLNRENASLDPVTDKEQMAANRRQIEANKKDAREASRAMIQARKELEGIKDAPAAVKKPTINTKVNPRRKGAYSDAEVERYLNK